MAEQVKATAVVKEDPKTKLAEKQAFSGGNNPNGGRGGRRSFGKEQADGAEFNQDKEVLIDVNRVVRVVKGGRRFRLQALVVVGNGSDMVGVGIAKAADVATASSKAAKNAKKNMRKIHLSEKNVSIPHEVIAKKSGAKIMLKPASLGTGLIAGGTVRAVLSVTGVKNILSKSLGSSNKINCAYATVDALTQLVAKEDWQTNQKSKSNKKPESNKADESKVAKMATPKSKPAADKKGKK